MLYEEGVRQIIGAMHQIRDACRELDPEPHSPFGHLRTNIERALAHYREDGGNMAENLNVAGDSISPLDPFVYHRPSEEQAQRMDDITNCAHLLWTAINAQVQECGEKGESLKRLRECRMWANAGVLFGDAANARRSS